MAPKSKSPSRVASAKPVRAEPAQETVAEKAPRRPRRPSSPGTPVESLHAVEPTAVKAVQVRVGVVQEAAPGHNPEERRRMIQEAAYYRSLKFGGHAEDNWRAAEEEVDQALSEPHAPRVHH